jgi:hypothetical protein
MKLSNETIEVLKNFASINMSLLVKPGSKLRTVSPQKTILAQANVKELFTKEYRSKINDTPLLKVDPIEWFSDVESKIIAKVKEML